MPTRWNFLYVNIKKNRKNRYLIFIIYAKNSTKYNLYVYGRMKFINVYIISFLFTMFLKIFV